MEDLEVPPSVAVHRKAEEQEGEYAANKIMIAARITTSTGGQGSCGGSSGGAGGLRCR